MGTFSPAAAWHQPKVSQVPKNFNVEPKFRSKFEIGSLVSSWCRLRVLFQLFQIRNRVCGTNREGFVIERDHGSLPVQAHAFLYIRISGTSFEFGSVPLSSPHHSIKS